VQVQRNIVARSRKHCCNENTTMHSVCVAELQVTVSYTKTLSVAQQCFMANLCRRQQ